MFGNTPTRLQIVERLARGRGMIRSRDLARRGLPTVYLGRLVRAHRLVRQSRGVYTTANYRAGPTHDAELACLRVPGGVLCLLSALAHHRIGSRRPDRIWMAVDSRAWRPRIDAPRLRIVRLSGPALTSRVLTVRTASGTIRVFDAAKTVADCFRFRNRIGLDVATEALREGWRGRRFTLDELAEVAEICRVGRVIRPYVAMLY